MKVVVTLILTLSYSLLANSELKDIQFAQVGDHKLLLDLHMPKKVEKPLIMWIHGGAWRAGDKAKVPILGLLD